MQPTTDSEDRREVYVRPTLPRAAFVSLIYVLFFGSLWVVSWRWLGPRLRGPMPPSPADGLVLALLPTVALLAWVVTTLFLVACYSLRIDDSGIETAKWSIDPVGRCPVAMMPSLRGFRWDEPLKIELSSRRRLRSHFVHIGTISEPVRWARFRPLRRRIFLPKLWILKDSQSFRAAIDRFAPRDHPLREIYLSKPIANQPADLLTRNV